MSSSASHRPSPIPHGSIIVIWVAAMWRQASRRSVPNPPRALVIARFPTPYTVYAFVLYIRTWIKLGNPIHYLCLSIFHHSRTFRTVFSDCFFLGVNLTFFVDQCQRLEVKVAMKSALDVINGVITLIHDSCDCMFVHIKQDFSVDWGST